jgi:hypothetical protein
LDCSHETASWNVLLDVIATGDWSGGGANGDATGSGGLMGGMGDFGGAGVCCILDKIKEDQ